MNNEDLNAIFSLFFNVMFIDIVQTYQHIVSPQIADSISFFFLSEIESSS